MPSYEILHRIHVLVAAEEQGAERRHSHLAHGRVFVSQRCFQALYQILVPAGSRLRPHALVASDIIH